jgi:phage gp36-like protein
VARTPVTQYAQPEDLQNVGALPSFMQSVTSDQMDEALVNASSMMDEAFASQFMLPLVVDPDNVPPIIIPGSVVQYCCWIAIFILITARGYDPEDPVQATFETRMKMSQAWLDRVGDGTRRPQVTDSSPSAAPGLTTPRTVSPTTGTPFAGQTWGTWARR